MSSSEIDKDGKTDAVKDSEEIEVDIEGVVEATIEFTKEAEVERFPWWRGGGVIPKSGREFGVFEKSLEDRANFFELWWMSYLNPLLDLGSRKVLDSEDVGIPSAQDRAEKAYSSAKKAWDEQVELCRIKNEPLIKLQKERDAELKQQEQKEPEVGESDTSGKKKRTETNRLEGTIDLFVPDIQFWKGQAHPGDCLSDHLFTVGLCPRLDS